MEKFICPHQFNYIRVQLNQLLQTVYFAGDYRVYAAHRLGVRDNVLSMFPQLGPSEIRLFDGMEDVKGQSEIGEFMQRLEPYVIPFPVLEPDNLRKLFPKVKKLPLPDLAEVNWSKLSYFGWRDIATNTLFVVTRHNGKLIGIRNRITSLNRPGVCCVCNHSGQDVGLVTTVAKASNYTTVGNHMCLNTITCNAAMTSLKGLVFFVEQAQRQR
ncbi:FusB/FusC family EF-G-binding protein [Alicyclobacillus ferrooxydans]|uniref:Elongation factor G-binding protein n=1 Tax=Alicyclobacillus ferrooxydans TaxID=471514 RepID=A0A0P9C1Y3_9BACL|nr:elongation factor G-binding protein [Alicyclobacillus ferrooxydans]KPV38946.1 hypothetical protein AN477_23175 [Alicyclobacillus ferrooxydans]